MTWPHISFWLTQSCKRMCVRRFEKKEATGIHYVVKTDKLRVNTARFFADVMKLK